MTVNRRVWMPAAAALGAVLGWTEWATWRASRELLPPSAVGTAPFVPDERVLVLGNPLRSVYRWRVRIAARSTDPLRARFIFSGGAVRTATAEAQMMAAYAMDTLGIPAANVFIEDQSRSTVENIANSLPLLVDGPAIKIASDTFHARRARRILHDQSPSLAGQLVRARDYRLFEYGPLHAVLVAFEGYRRHKARAAA